MKTRLTWLMCVVTIALASTTVWAIPDPHPDLDASTIYLRYNCTIVNSDGGQSQMENCFEDMTSVESYIYVNRTDKSAPLLVDIGPGSFSGQNAGFECGVNSPPGNAGLGGDLTFRGAGVGKTVIENNLGVLNHCSESKWAFESLTVEGYLYSVVWYGGGQSNWTNALLVKGWYDQLDGSFGICSSAQQGQHRFFSSRIVAQATFGNAYASSCAQSWFWGSEILYTPAPGASARNAIWVKGQGNELHLYGSNIRAEADPADSSTAKPLTAIKVTDGGSVHVHGVGMDLVGNTGWTVTAYDASSGGMIHANETAYHVEPLTGVTFSRIINNGGHVHAPYLWEHIPTQTFMSANGADVTTVTTGTSDNQPHLAIYSTACNGWYDTTDKVCR